MAKMGLKFRIMLLGAGLYLVAGCASYVAPPVTPDFRRHSRADAALLQRGYVVHEAKCAKCHPFEDPRKYPEGELRDEIMPVMIRKSKLDEADGRAVTEYLLAARRMPVEEAAP